MQTPGLPELQTVCKKEVASTPQLLILFIMAERKCVYDPLTELMAYYQGKTGTKEKVDTTNLPVEERLKQRIIDGDQIGLDNDLAEALKAHDPLIIINTFLLDGMKVVGELFGSGQMQLPFVLQSAETMKSAVAFLEPYMEKSEDNAKGTMVLATVKGDVHDIGKNLVDIILTNNGYRVINLGIKVPVDTMLESAVTHKATAIGMSGLLVKSTLVMKENLQLMKGREIEIPVVLGGAALTRRYVEHDLREIYGPNVAYAEDAFAGLRYMERLANGIPLAGEAPAAGPATPPPTTEEGEEQAPKASRRFVERGSVRVRSPFEEELEMLGDIMGVELEDLLEADLKELFIAELNERVIGGGRLLKASEDDEVYELTNIAMLPEQWSAGAGMELIRAMRRRARALDENAAIYVACDPEDTELGRFYRTLGFELVPLTDPRALIAREKVNYCVETYGKAPALYFSKSAAAVSDGPAGEISRHLQQEQERDADFPVSSEEYETDLNVHRRRVTSDVDRNLPVPHPPFYGSRVVENVRIEKVFEYINEIALIRGQWQVKKGTRSSDEYRRELDQIVHPKLEEMKLLAKRERLLNPKVIYGYFPCRADYNSLIIYKPKGLEGDALYGEWPDPILDEEHLEEWERFEFPRQPHGRHLCIADFFRSVESAEFDVVPFQIVTMGSRASEYAANLFAANDYANYLYFHGLSVESAEALAEYWHKSVRTELGIAGNDAEDIRRLFSQGYQGSRYSFGYAACPNLEDQTKLFTMLRPERIGVALSDEFMLEPEQSTSALVVHHPAAKYFNVRE